MKLRPYQNESIELLRNSFRKNKRVILCLPTGAGKTVTFSEMIRLNYEKGKVSLILTDRTELCKQAVKSITKHEIPIQIIEEGTNPNDVYLNAKVFVAMVESLNNNIKKGLEINPDLIIIDEAHKGNFTKLIAKFPNAYIIGATATPVGKHIPKIYTDIVQCIDIPELIEEGWLSKMKAFQMVDNFDDLEVSSTGEFTEESQYKHFKKSKVFDGFVEVFSGKKTLVFCCNIQHSIDVCEAFKAKGIRSEVVTSLTAKEERTRILSAYSAGYFDVLVNCGILTTGYDEPTIEDIVIVRATTSIALWLQMCGRGSRVIPGKKENFTIYDFGGNHDRHGLWNQPREWSLVEKKRKKSDGISPVNSCPNCEALLAVSARSCEYCEFEFEQVAKEDLKGVLVEVVQSVEVKVPENLIGKRIGELEPLELFELQKSKKYKPTFIWRIVRNLGEKAVKEYAEIANYKKGWIYSQMQKLDEKSFTNFVLR
jgi:superfamily II DNA or RNA helicase